MFCKECGHENNDSANFCENCGTKISLFAEAEPVENNDENTVDTEKYDTQVVPVEIRKENISITVTQNDRIKKILMIASSVIALILIAVLVLASGVFTPAYKKAVKKYFEAKIDGDGKTICELTVNPVEFQQKLDSGQYDSKKEMIERYEDIYDDMEDDFEYRYGEDVKLRNFEVKKVYKYDKKDVKLLSEYLEDEYNYDVKSLQDIVSLKVKATVGGRYDVDTDTDEIVVVKIKGKWYVENIGGLYDNDSIKLTIKRLKTKD